MKVYKEIANISYDAFNSQKFTSEIAKYLKKYKKNIKHFLIIYGILQIITLYMKQIRQVQNYLI